MMTTLYSLSVIGIIASLMLIYRASAMSQNNKSGKYILGISVFTFLFSLFFKDGGLFGMLFSLGRDLPIIAISALIFNRAVRKTWTMILTGLVVYGVIHVLHFSIPSFFEDLFEFESTKTEESTTYNANSKLDTDAEILIDVKSGSSQSDIEKLLADFEVDIRTAFRKPKNLEASEIDDYLAIDVPAAQINSLPQIMSLLQNSDLVEGLELNEVLSATPIIESEQGTVNKSSINTNDPEVSKQWGLEVMQVASLYEWLAKQGKPSKRAKIAILDTGVEGEHEDLADNFSSTDSDYDRDKVGHGTHCAGIAGAVSGNGVGIASFAPNADFIELTSIKVLSDEGYGTQQGIIDGIIEAADGGADVISMSLGGMSTDESQRAYSEAIKYANKCGAIVVAAAGNSSDDTHYYSPANADGVIAVTAVSSDLKLANFSNYFDGSIKMGVAAPGVEIYATYPDNSYRYLSGTSMATPYVAGLLGMMKAFNPDLSTEEAYQILNETGVETPSKSASGKFIQPLAAVQKAIK
ncbi:MAG: subtilisin [Cytophagales bacterium]|nr:MAG: subtilisin [Cytophagales bacterium]TAF60253.1 MAG: subtilisin [Cytophagales bacterium]